MIKKFTQCVCALLMLGGASTAIASHLSGLLYCDANQNQQIDINDFALEGKVSVVLDTVFTLHGDTVAQAGNVYEGVTDGSGMYYIEVAFPATAEYTATVSNLQLNGANLSSITYITPASDSAGFVVASSGENAEINWLVDSPDCHQPAPFCGDGNLDFGEQCDDGNNQDGDHCSATCTVEAFCGDGIVDPNEGCDDGNNVNGDSCSAECTLEFFCGDGVLNVGEQCDDNNNIDGDGCSSSCTVEPFCGDGNLDPGEQCDDANNVNGDGCSAVCAVEGGGQGCTPGYWKQPHHFDSWSSQYTPDTQFSDVFEDAFPGMTLLGVMEQGGGQLNALGRHTVAGLLNAASGGVSYDRSEGQIIDMFNSTFPGNGGAYNGTKNVFEYFNEQGCPLN